LNLGAFLKGLVRKARAGYLYSRIAAKASLLGNPERIACFRKTLLPDIVEV
jgi:hypothetical protein